MFLLWSTLAGLGLWLEIVYHFGGFGWEVFNPIYAVFLITAWAAAGTLAVGLARGRIKRIVFYGAVWLPLLWTAVQLVYLHIFRQPLLWEMLFRSGQDALANYWREALQGVLETLPSLFWLFLPAALLPFARRMWNIPLPQFTSLQVLRTLALFAVGCAGSFAVMGIGKSAGLDYYEEYHEFYDPLTVAEEMGVAATLQGDTAAHGRRFLEKLFPPKGAGGASYVPAISRDVAQEGSPSAVTVSGGNPAARGQEPENAVVPQVSGGDEDGGQPEEQEDVIRPQEFSLDYEMLHQLADNDHQAWLADYIQNQTPVTTNAYTGLFEGYNLIFLTAEGFSSYAIDEELTPTLYRLANSGFVFENYYVPLWQTSTSDGEYVNMTGLIPDGQHSMFKSSANLMPYALPGFFAGEGVESYAYHNNSLSYYDRYLTHPNLGYDFKASKLGDLEEETWGGKVFAMEDPDQWPASDYNMMVATVPEYVGKERFHVYYMTVSGHMNYNFKGNAMSAKNRDAVANLEMSDGAKAYLACNIELDKAMAYLLEQLAQAGQLEKTVICLSADHYPYAMPIEQYEELAGRDVSEGKDLFRNSLILWNVSMEENPVYVDKVCGAMDLLPTLLNLFGFDYDSRMYAGRDIFSEGEGMVIFNNRDFVTDSVTFIEKGDIATWRQDDQGNDLIPDGEKEAYLAAARQEVKDRYNFSAYLLQENYYADVAAAVIPPDAPQ